MENEVLLKEVTAKAQVWLGEGYDAETRAEVRRMLDSEDKTDLIEAFYKDLEFGTGGLRGIMGGPWTAGMRPCREPYEYLYRRSCDTRIGQLSEKRICFATADKSGHRA